MNTNSPYMMQVDWIINICRFFHCIPCHKKYLNILFYSLIFSQGKKSNSPPQIWKPLDWQKKWKDKIVLHYLISIKMNFFSSNFDAINTFKYWFPKIVDFTNKEISWKWWLNSDMFEKTWLLQESTSQPKTVFAAIVNKSLTFNCSIIDVDNTIFF